LDYYTKGTVDLDDHFYPVYMIKIKVAFGGPTFFQSIRAIWKVFKISDWLEKSRPSKKVPFVWSRKQAICVFHCFLPA